MDADVNNRSALIKTSLRGSSPAALLRPQHVKMKYIIVKSQEPAIILKRLK